MRFAATTAALAASVSTVTAAVAGFNYGSTFTTGAAKQQADFENEFKAAAALPGVPVTFNAARLYTTVQAGTANSPSAAIPAAINTGTTLLLTLWASAGDAAFANELSALKSAIGTYGSSLAPHVIGISVGSEDLYRISPTGIANKENPGVGPDVLVNYINQVRTAISGTPLASTPVGHVDTWTAWVNGSNNAVIASSDWVGVDGYPYFQNTQANAIENEKGLFQDSIDATRAAVGSKPIWVTETGFPVSGKSSGDAVPSIQNAKTYWDQVGCPMFGNTNVFWYTLWDADPDTPNPSFGIISTLGGAPLYDLSCANTGSGSSSSSSSSSSTSSSTSSTSSSSSSSNGGGGGGSSNNGGSGSSSGSSGSGSSTSTTTTSQQSGSSSGGGGSGNGSPSSTTSASTSSSTGSSTGSGSGSTSSTGSNSTSTTSKASSSPTVAPNAAPATVASSGLAFFLAIVALMVM